MFLTVDVPSLMDEGKVGQSVALYVIKRRYNMLYMPLTSAHNLELYRKYPNLSIL